MAGRGFAEGVKPRFEGNAVRNRHDCFVFDVTASIWLLIWEKVISQSSQRVVTSFGDCCGDIGTLYLLMYKEVMNGCKCTSRRSRQ